MGRLRLTKIASITAELDKIADEIQEQSPLIALAIDRISDIIEKGAPTQHSQAEKNALPQSGGQAKPVDPKTLKPEDLEKLRVKVNIQASSIVHDRYIMAMVVEAGLKDEFMKLFEKGKSSWMAAWNEVKDKSMQLAIKGLDTADKIKEFIAKHPNLKWAVLAAIILGFLVLPTAAHAEIMDTSTVQNMAKDLHWQFLQTAGGGATQTQMTVGVPKGWVGDIVLKSLANHGLADSSAAIKDVAQNIKNIIDMKAKMTGITDPDMLNQLKNESAKFIIDAIKPLLAKFGLVW